MRRPAKWEIIEFAKLAKMTEFLKEKHRPFTAIARKAVELKLIQKKKTSQFYGIFSVCVRHIGIFEGEFYPSDQTPTNLDRWEWKLPGNITQYEFMKRINEYVQENFKTPL